MSGALTATQIGIGLIGAGLIGSAYAGISSANTQKDVAGQQTGMAGTVFGEQQGYEQQLHNLIANPSSVTSLPGYSFNLSQGEQAVARQFGPTAGSGAEGIALQQYGQGYAMNTYNQQVQTLSSLAGLSSPVNPSTAASGASAATSASNNSIQQLLAALTASGGIVSGLYGGTAAGGAALGGTLNTGGIIGGSYSPMGGYITAVPGY